MSSGLLYAVGVCVCRLSTSSVAVATGSAPAVTEPTATKVAGYLACSVLLLELAILEALSRLHELGVDDLH